MTTTVLQTEHLTKRFGQLTAVDDLSLEVHEGEVFGFSVPMAQARPHPFR